MAETIDQIRADYLAKAHAMQSGVAAMMEKDPTNAEPKHLRVGINSAMVNDAALARLLIAKGILTEIEYAAEVRDEMGREVERYEKECSAAMGGVKITLV